MTPQGAATVTLVIILILLFKFPDFFVYGLLGLILLIFALTLWKVLCDVFGRWL